MALWRGGDAPVIAGGQCAVPEPMAMPGGIGLVGTPEGPVGTPVAPGCPPYGPTPPGHGAHTREKTTHPGEIFVSDRLAYM